MTAAQATRPRVRGEVHDVWLGTDAEWDTFPTAHDALEGHDR